MAVNLALKNFWFPEGLSCGQVFVRLNAARAFSLAPLTKGDILTFRFILILLISMASSSARAGLRCPKGSLPVTKRGFQIRGENYGGLKEIPIAHLQTITLCFKVRKRADYLMIPYEAESGANLRAVFNGSVDLRNLPVVKSPKGYFEKEVVLISVTAMRVDESICQSYPPACEKSLMMNVFWRPQRGPTPIETLCPDGFLPPFFNNITQQYYEGYFGYRQVPLIPGVPKKFCYFLSRKTSRFHMYIADRTGPAQCGYHYATYSPPPNDRTTPIYTNSPTIISAGHFWMQDGSNLPRGIYTIEATATGQIPNCNNKMEIATD